MIDNGWTSAPFWPQARAAASAAAAEAERARAPVFLLLTAPEKPARDAGEALTAADARGRIARLEPQPWRPDRADAAERFARTRGNFDRIIWISDGLQDDGARALAEALSSRGPVTARLPPLPARAITSAAVTPRGVEIEARRASNGSPVAAVAAETLEGRALGAAELRFAGDALTAKCAHRTAAGDRRARRACAVGGRDERGRGALVAGGIGTALRWPRRSRRRRPAAAQ
ncbi:MAG: hypothetical protein WDM79_12685 [Terricaulis sp.]